MSLPFSRYHIATSHNTYLGGTQALTCSRKKAIVKALQDGARMIELDIFYDSYLKNIVISHGKFVSSKCNCLFTTPMTLEDACESISAFVTPATSPIILMLEVNIGSDSDRQKMAADAIKQVLGQYLVSGDIDLRMTFPEHYLGKILLGAGGGVVSPLNELINLKFSSDECLYNRSYKSLLSDQIYYGGLLIGGNVIRSYPTNIYLSKNFNPKPLFDLGVQFVGMNYQTKDEYMNAYREMFKDSQMIGYVPIKQII